MVIHYGRDRSNTGACDEAFRSFRDIPLSYILTRDGKKLHGVSNLFLTIQIGVRRNWCIQPVSYILTRDGKKLVYPTSFLHSNKGWEETGVSNRFLTFQPGVGRNWCIQPCPYILIRGGKKLHGVSNPYLTL